MPTIADYPKALYSRPMRSTRGGPLFNAFPYPTKISPEAAALFIASHTRPGETVLDCFAGSGTTGLGAILSARPTPQMINEASRMKLPVEWGSRRAVLFEVGVLGAFVSRVLSSPPDPDSFKDAAESLLLEASREMGWVYGAVDNNQELGTIRYIVWSDILQCPHCRKQFSFWDACVSRNPVNISGKYGCPGCKKSVTVEDTKRLTTTEPDSLLNETRRTRKRRPVWLYGSTNGRMWDRPAKPSDTRLLSRIASEPLPASVPIREIPWGDLHRSGYHEGMTHLHHFYTHRNLLVFATLWNLVSRFPAILQDALRFWLLSYNASHATIMTRVVAKKGQSDLVVTSGQPGVLYVSGLPVEKNIFSGLRRKLATIHQAFTISRGHEGMVTVHNASCLDTRLPDESIDYVFTDPPFGGNIPYAEVNFINEAWLGRITDTTEEVIVSPHQGKQIEDYQDLLSRAFSEAHRVLRRNGKATVVFHSTSAQVWNALQNACATSGLSVARTSVLDKTQASFKQVTTRGAVSGDPVILLEKTRKRRNSNSLDIWHVADRLLQEARTAGNTAEALPRRVYSRLVAHYLAAHEDVPINAQDFYRRLGERQASNGD